VADDKHAAMSDRVRVSPLQSLALPAPPEPTDTASNAAHALLLEHVPGVAFCQVFARRGRGDEVESILLGRGLVDGFSRGAGPECLPLAPGQWLLLAGAGADGELCAHLRASLDGLADVSDQGHARALIRLRGVNVISLLSRGCSLDLSAFETPTEGWYPRRRAVAQTLLLGVPVVIYHDHKGPGFNVIVYPGFAMTLWELLVEAAHGLSPACFESSPSAF